VTEGELLDAIIAAPDDDDLRLVYSDWLSERGDPWGEVIRLQLERERDPLRMLLQGRLAELAPLEKRFGLGGESLTCKRGFPSSVSLTFDKLGLLEAWRGPPLDNLTLFVGNAAELRAAIADPRVQRVRGLTLYLAMQRLPAVLDELLASPWVTGLRSFRIEGAGADVVRAIARHRWLRLERLGLRSSEIPQGSLSDLRGHALRELDLHQASLEDGALEELALAPWPLAELDVTKVPLAGHVARLATRRGLRQLRASRTGLDDTSGAHLGGLEGLELLRVEDCALGPVALRALGRLPSLRSLSIERCPVGDEGIAALCEGRPRLQSLYATQTGVGAGVGALCGLKELEVLSVGDETLTARDLATATPLLPQLFWLSLSGSPIGDEGAGHLAGLGTSELRSLILDRCGIGPAGLEALSTSPALERLTLLSLRSNHLTAEHATLAWRLPALRLLNLGGAFVGRP
jgi:uncharacterized protein (TIGR02996 family)